MAAVQTATMARPEPDIAPAPAAVSIRDVAKAYGPAGSHVLALGGISLEAAPGEFLCLVGASGCGKSTLLNLIAGLDHPGAGPVAGPREPALLFHDPGLLPPGTEAPQLALGP